MAQKTNEEIQALKNDWCDDSSWDIENTEGFQEHHDELLAFRKECEAKWKIQEEKRFAKSFDGQVLQIKKELDELDVEVGEACSHAELASLEISRLNVRALLLLAEQISDVKDAIEDRTSYEKYLRGN